MRITCDVDCNMGYITLMPSRHFGNYKSNLNQYYKDIDLEIPILKGNHLSKKLENMKLMNKTYKRALYGADADIDSEYGNDIDNDGYITGIELTLKKNKFIQLIRSKAFRIYEISLNEKNFHLITFDLPDITFNSKNVIYPLTEKNDSYYVSK
ncbi:hypothetical protein [Clostridium ganghwense]|uniref:Uncharacterized protein n=1 Tax=Clostridium ganghwense TaxID=312089 RepID=A0ABT4CT34_9CLOT|nr:hypothetical protein [Clostridium ganghwense]MCY6371593.1 hypothetical protein [Clostridium ganghwense]